MLHEWLARALQFSGKSQTDLARLLTDRLGREISKSAVGLMLKGPPPAGRNILGDELLAIEQITGYPIPSITQDFPREEQLRWWSKLSRITPDKREPLYKFLPDDPDER